MKPVTNSNSPFKLSLLLLVLCVFTNVVVVRCDGDSDSGSDSDASVPNSASLGPIVKIPQGELQGSVEKSRGGNEFYGYWGIPYAAPPKRFQPPEPAPVPGWKGVRNATVPGAWCTQAGFFGNERHGAEDCLVLNVFTKSKSTELLDKKEDLKPVLVYIHGGAFSVGSGLYARGGFFMDEPLV